jgi:hypothetical protein
MGSQERRFDMKGLWPIFALAFFAGATPAMAQAEIRQYQQDAVPTPYPDAAGGANVGAAVGPSQPMMTPEESTGAGMSPVLPESPGINTPSGRGRSR